MKVTVRILLLLGAAALFSSCAAYGYGPTYGSEAAAGGGQFQPAK